jgi:hypothetical protein
MSGQSHPPKDDGRCSVCDSTNIVWVEDMYFTGVGLDGYAEQWLWQGVRCKDCGALEER